MSVPKVKLAGTDLEVSRLCLGCWQFNNEKANINWDAQSLAVSVCHSMYWFANICFVETIICMSTLNNNFCYVATSFLIKYVDVVKAWLLQIKAKK